MEKKNIYMIKFEKNLIQTNKIIFCTNGALNIKNFNFINFNS